MPSSIVAQMLVFPRRRDESTVIGEDTTVTVVEIAFNRVRLGVVAPKEVSVHRGEVYEKMRRSQGSEGLTPPDIRSAK